MDLLFINAGMSLSVCSFLVGYFYRKKDVKLHVYFNTAGVFFNVTSALYLLAIKYIFGGLEKAGIFPLFSNSVITTHRIFAAVCFVMMFAMTYSGYTKKKSFHTKLHYIFLPLYIIVYVSGLFLFTTNKPL
jgi:uncharacterized membrane protein YozB (DUF420 family)